MTYRLGTWIINPHFLEKMQNANEVWTRHLWEFWKEWHRENKGVIIDEVRRVRTVNGSGYDTKRGNKDEVVGSVATIKASV